jgi:hypothetical protein
MEDKNQFISIKDILSLGIELIAVLKNRFKTIFLISVFLGFAGISIAYFAKPKYKAHLSFLLNENESNSINLSSLAGLAGLGSGSLSSGVNEDKLLFLSNSRFLLGTTLLTNVKIHDKSQLLINYFLDKYETQKAFKKDTLLADFKYFTNAHLDSLDVKENKVLDIVIKFIEDNQLLKVEGKKKTGIVAQNAGILTIDFFSIDEVLSKTFVDCLYANISKYYINKSIQRQYRNYTLIKERADSLKLILQSKETYGASYMDQNANLTKMQARVSVERTRRDIELLNLMYAEVMKNLEISKFSLENQTPMLQVIDSPTYPLKVEKKSKIKFGLLGSIIGGFSSLIVLFLVTYFKKQNSL